MTPLHETYYWGFFSWTGLIHYGYERKSAGLRHANSKDWKIKVKWRILYVSVVLLSFSRDQGDSGYKQGGDHMD